MTAIRDVVYDVYEDGTIAILEALGIDPDTPAEWATVDACLDWLRKRDMLCLEVYEDGHAAVDVYVGGRDNTAQTHTGGPTLHAALIAACRAVQEEQP